MFNRYYKHYKKNGSIYEELMEGLHTETNEICIVYRNLKGEVYIRPKQMFFEKVNINSINRVHRFKPITDPLLLFVLHLPIIGKYLMKYFTNP